MQRETLNKLHGGHQGIERCRQRARISVWWPGISNQIKEMIRHCSHCSKEKTQWKEPLMPSTLYPWQRIGIHSWWDNISTHHWLFFAVSRNYQTHDHTIAALKSTFFRYGIPEEVVSDNGPQYSSQEFGDFAKECGFRHITSSPHFPQSKSLGIFTYFQSSQSLSQ